MKVIKFYAYQFGGGCNSRDLSGTESIVCLFYSAGLYGNQYKAVRGICNHFKG